MCVCMRVCVYIYIYIYMYWALERPGSQAADQQTAGFRNSNRTNGVQTPGLRTMKMTIVAVEISCGSGIETLPLDAESVQTGCSRKQDRDSTNHVAACHLGGLGPHARV